VDEGCGAWEDSIDAIVRVKNAKYLKKDIAAALAREGRTNYHAKTIGTRWARIKRTLQRVQDQMLDDELTDWQEGDVSTRLQRAETPLELTTPR
jgi:hypothetical protein